MLTFTGQGGQAKDRLQEHFYSPSETRPGASPQRIETAQLARDEPREAQGATCRILQAEI